MTKPARLILSLSLCVSLACMTTSLAAKDSLPTSTQTTSAAKSSTPISFLFVISSDKAKITMPSKNTYKLTMHRTDLNQALVFSDRPERIVQTITPKELQANWKASSNSFKVDPPNAVLSSNETKPVIIILNNMHVDTNDLSFLFTTDHTMTARDMKKMTLTIDSANNCAMSSLFNVFIGASAILDGVTADVEDKPVTGACGTVTYYPI